MFHKHHPHEGCSHSHHDHEECSHDHDHDHDMSGSFTRHAFSPEELKDYESLPINSLAQVIKDFLDKNQFGHAAPLQEIYIKRIPSTDPTSLHINQHDLAFSYSNIGELESAMNLWQEVLSALHKNPQENPGLLCEVLFHMADICIQGDNITQAKGLYEEGLKTAEKYQQGFWHAALLHELALIDLNDENYTLAEEKLSKVIAATLEASAEPSVQELLMSARFHLAICIEGQGHKEKARVLYKELLALCKNNTNLDLLRHMLEEHLAEMNASGLKEKLSDFR
jgi:tetratricopeptide (TPR) repeat protein